MISMKRYKYNVNVISDLAYFTSNMEVNYYHKICTQVFLAYTDPNIYAVNELATPQCTNCIHQRERQTRRLCNAHL